MDIFLVKRQMPTYQHFCGNRYVCPNQYLCCKRHFWRNQHLWLSETAFLWEKTFVIRSTTLLDYLYWHIIPAVLIHQCVVNDKYVRNNKYVVNDTCQVNDKCQGKDTPPKRCVEIITRNWVNNKHLRLLQCTMRWVLGPPPCAYVWHTGGLFSTFSFTPFTRYPQCA